MYIEDTELLSINNYLKTIPFSQELHTQCINIKHCKYQGSNLHFGHLTI